MTERNVGSAQRIQYGRVFFDPKRNVRDHNIVKDSPNFKKLLKSFVRDGWKDNVPQFWGMVSPIKPEEAARCLEIRTKELADLEALAKQQGSESDVGYEYAVRKALYLDANGNLITPEFLGACGHQRAYVYPYAMAARLKGGQVDDFVIGVDCPNTLEVEIPVIIREFATELERLDAMVDENERKTEGYSPMSISDNLHTSQKMVNLGATQQDLRRRFTPTTGQKLWGIVKLGARFPRLDLLNRICNLDKDGGPVVNAAGEPGTRPDYIAYGKIDGPALPNVLIVSDPKLSDADLEKWNNEQASKKTKWSPLSRMSESDVGALFSAWASGDAKKNAEKIMKKDEIGNLAKHENLIVHKVATAIFEDDKQHLEVLSKVVVGTNALYNMANVDGVNDLCGALLDLEGIKERPDFLQVCKSVREYVQGLLTPTVGEQKPKRQTSKK